MTWREDREWKGRGLYIGRNKEVFGAEVFAITQALEVIDERGEEGQHYTIFSDSQAALARIRYDGTGPAQAVARRAIHLSECIVGRENTITLYWTPSHRGIEGNEQADTWAKRAAEGREGRAEEPFVLEASLAHNRKVTESRAEMTASWIRDHSG